MSVEHFCRILCRSRTRPLSELSRRGCSREPLPLRCTAETYPEPVERTRDPFPSRVFHRGSPSRASIGRDPKENFSDALPFALPPSPSVSFPEHDGGTMHRDIPQRSRCNASSTGFSIDQRITAGQLGIGSRSVAVRETFDSSKSTNVEHFGLV